RARDRWFREPTRDRRYVAARGPRRQPPSLDRDGVRHVETVPAGHYSSPDSRPRPLRSTPYATSGCLSSFCQTYACRHSRCFPDTAPPSSRDGQPWETRSCPHPPPRPKAKVALARKLLVRLYVMLRDPVDYEEFRRRGRASQPSRRVTSIM